MLHRVTNHCVVNRFGRVGVFALALSLLVQLVSVRPSLAQEESAAGGGGSGTLENFQTDLFTGRFSYTIPITVPPGRQGGEPKITLGYNSSGGNGWCGMGWTLEMGFIQRETREGVPVKWDPASQVTPYDEYDDNKGFVAAFAGVQAKLVEISTDSYRAEIDQSFMKFDFHRTGSDNYWEVTDRSGNRYFFGETSGSRMENAKWTSTTGDKKTFRWSLNRILDINGNETTLTYTTDQNSLYLDEITYNDNTNDANMAATHSVKFVLEDRTDDSINFQPAYRVETNKRLKEIKVTIVRDTTTIKVRRYALGYTYSPSTARSLLTSVTQYGSDDTTTLPAITFDYQELLFEFDSPVDWGTLDFQGGTNPGWGYPVGNVGTPVSVGLEDMDGDGLPDRVMTKRVSPHNIFKVQYNTGSGFGTAVDWQSLDTDGQTGINWNSVGYSNSTGSRQILRDMNGDNFVDRVFRKVSSPYNNLRVQYHTGTGFDTPPENFGTLDFQGGTNTAWGHPIGTMDSGKEEVCGLYDINGDGLPDRVMRKRLSPYDKFLVQFHTGTGFSTAVNWSPLDTDGNTTRTWNSVSYSNANGGRQILADINGDGLPDRLCRKQTKPYDQLRVQFNNGAGFEDPENWGPLDAQGGTGDAWGYPTGRMDSGHAEMSGLYDLNGDGLLDRVMRKQSSPYNVFKVQFNTGTGFSSTLEDWGTIDTDGQNGSSWNSPAYSHSDGWRQMLRDMNGDGLLDRVFRKASTPYDRLRVQLASGPTPDLLSQVDNGIGGTVDVTYKSSTKYDNDDSAGVSQLRHPIYTVSSVTVNDGMGMASQTTYDYLGGMWDYENREFRGFNCVTVTDPLGSYKKTYFHQGGGRDESNEGEFQDDGSIAKKGIPYCTEIYGSDDKLYSKTLNKVEEVALDSTAGWCFPYISQTIMLEYEGLDAQHARATCKQFTYDATANDTSSTGNLLKESDLGEVTSVSIANHTFTDVNPGGTSDNVYTHFTYATFTNTDIINKPDLVKITSDSAGNTVLRKTDFDYDTKGNVTAEKLWRDTDNTWITNATTYDAVGNVATATSPLGIVTKTTYDGDFRTFPITVTIYRQGEDPATDEHFTIDKTFDIRSGETLASREPSGFASWREYDVFFRLAKVHTATVALAEPTSESTISTEAGRVDTTAPISATKRTEVIYNLGAIVNNLSQNYTHEKVTDVVDAINGHETYTYTDGLGRTIQVRTEAETSAGVNNDFRVVSTVYDERGNTKYQSLSYFGDNADYTAYNAVADNTKVTTTYDPIGRVASVVPGNDDTGSDLGTSSTAYKHNNDPWATVSTDPKSKVRRSFHDARGQTIKITEVTSGADYDTTFRYNLLSQMTAVEDDAGNDWTMTYNSLGHKLSMTDPDVGSWTYKYDDVGRMTEQVDGEGNKITFHYDAAGDQDLVGRLLTKKVYAASDLVTPEETITFEYDDGENEGQPSGYVVFPTQVFKVADGQGWVKHSYDIRGNVLKSTRYLNVNTSSYTVETTYDAVDRPTSVDYPVHPSNPESFTLDYTYDTGGNLVKAESASGPTEVFYDAQGFNDQGQLTGIDYGNGLATTYTYYTNSKRLKQTQTDKPGGGNHQDLTYTYDEVSNVLSIADGVNSSGSASASINTITYDDLHRLTSLYSVAQSATIDYAYNAIGNMTLNEEAGVGTYSYGAVNDQPHAVTSANGKNYTYDDNGNMLTRGSNQTLSFDAQSRLKQVDIDGGSGTPGGVTVTYGYDDGGERLWKKVNDGTTTRTHIYIGGIYEERPDTRAGQTDTTTLVHVFAGDKRVCTLEPNESLASAIMDNKLARAGFDLLMWPLRPGHGGWTFMLLMLIASLFTCRRGMILPVRRWWLKRLRRAGKWRHYPHVVRALLSRGTLSHRTGVTARPHLDSQGITWRRRDRRRFYLRNPWRQIITAVCLVAMFFVALPPETVAGAGVPDYDAVFYYCHNDHLTSTNIQTDRDGDLVQHYEYSAFGREKHKNNTLAFNVSHRFTGQILDEDTGLYYYGSRYYDAELGRFVQADAIVPEASNPQTLNRYSYVNNNPLKYVDPSGNFPGLVELVVGLVAAFAVGAGTAAVMGGDILKTGLAFAASFAIGHIGGHLLPTQVWTKAAISSAQGATNAAIQGGDVGLSALRGALDSTFVHLEDGETLKPLKDDIGEIGKKAGKFANKSTSDVLQKVGVSEKHATKLAERVGESVTEAVTSQFSSSIKLVQSAVYAPLGLDAPGVLPVPKNPGPALADLASEAVKKFSPKMKVLDIGYSDFAGFAEQAISALTSDISHEVALITVGLIDPALVEKGKLFVAAFSLKVTVESGSTFIQITGKFKSQEKLIASIANPTVRSRMKFGVIEEEEKSKR